MLNLKLALLISLALMSNAAFADLRADVQAGMTVEKIVANASAEGLNPVEIFNQVSEADPELILSVLMVLTAIYPEQAEEIVIAAMIKAPQELEAIIKMATASGVSNETILTAAISAGIDPTLIAKPTAAGTEESLDEANTIPTSPGIGDGSGDGGGSVSPN